MTHVLLVRGNAPEVQHTGRHQPLQGQAPGQPADREHASHQAPAQQGPAIVITDSDDDFDPTMAPMPPPPPEQHVPEGEDRAPLDEADSLYDDDGEGSVPAPRRGGVMQRGRRIIDDSDSDDAGRSADAPPPAPPGAQHGPASQQQASQHGGSVRQAPGWAPGPPAWAASRDASPAPSLEAPPDAHGPPTPQAALAGMQDPAHRTLTEIRDHVMSADAPAFPVQCSARVRFDGVAGKLRFVDAATRGPLPGFGLDATIVDACLAVPVTLAPALLQQLLGAPHAPHMGHGRMPGMRSHRLSASRGGMSLAWLACWKSGWPCWGPPPAPALATGRLCT